MNDAKSVYYKFDTLTDSLTDEACSHKVFRNGRPKNAIKSVNIIKL